jgi:LruC domain-containing protein
MKVFLDGLFRTSVVNSGNLQSSASDVLIGKQTTLNPFKGVIDEMLIYDRALTETEVLQIFGSTPDPGNGYSELVSYWNLDENAGIIANDSKGGNNGTITGATWGQGISGSCLTFDGTSGLVKVLNKINLNPVNQITMMAWAKTTVNKTTKIFQKGDWDGHGLGQGNWDGWQAHVRLADNTSQTLQWGDGLPILNQWYHLAMTYDGTQLKFYVNGQLKNSKVVSGLLKVNNRDLSIGSDNGVQKFFNGSIDDLKFFSRALDQTEIQANYTQTGNSPDQDGDGVPDADDSYPKDPARAFNNFYPADGFGSLAFEDLWPGKGDYDFNDLVLGYRFKTITNVNNKVTEVVATFVIRAIGAGLQNGFGFQLPGTAVAGADAEVTGYKLKESFINLNPNGTEAGQEKLTVIVFDNVNKIMPSPGGFGVNVQPGSPYLDPDTTHVSIIIKPNIYTMDDIGIDRFNPFLIVNLDRGKEVHLADNLPTSLVNTTYFKTGDDNTDPEAGRYYKTVKNLPWAIRIPSGFDYTIEGALIMSAYLNFAPWAESSGTQYPDWYLKKSGYRNESNIYQVP